MKCNYNYIRVIITLQNPQHVIIIRIVNFVLSEQFSQLGKCDL